MAINYLPFEQSDAEEVRDIIEAEGRKAVLIPGDISSERFCEELVKTAIDELGGLDNLTLVAGMQQYNRDIVTLPDEQMRKTFETNSLFYVQNCARGFAVFAGRSNDYYNLLYSGISTGRIVAGLCVNQSGNNRIYPRFG